MRNSSPYKYVPGCGALNLSVDESAPGAIAPVVIGVPFASLSTPGLGSVSGLAVSNPGAPNTAKLCGSLRVFATSSVTQSSSVTTSAGPGTEKPLEADSP